MKLTLVGKRVERMNKFGDDLCLELKDNGSIKFSPALLSRLNVSKASNRFGIAYSDTGNAYLYMASDNQGVAINAQGIANNMPHNRDLRSQYDLSTTGKVTLYIKEDFKTFDDFSNYKFYEIYTQTEENSVSLQDTSTDVEETTSYSSEYVDYEKDVTRTFTSSTEEVPVESVEAEVEKDEYESIW